MSLDQPGSVPVDTHMLNIARRYLPHLATQKTITGKVHKEVGEHFRSLLGPWAGKELCTLQADKFCVFQLSNNSSSTGWAHSVLFSADLKHLQQLKKENPDVQDQKSSRIKEETPKYSMEVLEDVEKKDVKEEIRDELHQKKDIVKEEEENVKSGTSGGDDVPVDIENTIKNSSVKAKSKPVKKLKKTASPSFGEISPFRRKKLKT